MCAYSEKVWFSHREKKWVVNGGKFHWTEEKQVWDWDNSKIGFVRTGEENKLRIIVRSEKNTFSTYMKSDITLRYMLGFDAKHVSEPKSEPYTARKYKPEKIEGPKERWVFQLDDDYWIWQWAEKEEDLHLSPVYRLYDRIRDEIETPSLTSHNIFEVDMESENDRVIPIIYQPSVDALKNFVREIHCAETKSKDRLPEVEVSILFNNERLRDHGVLNPIYEWYRMFRYGRVLDLETIKIRVPEEEDEKKFVFESIYSDDAQLNVDDKHGDPPIAPERRVKYYFVNHKNPIIFVNTSNHSMAEHDTNHRLWKWEYVPWIENSPIKLGTKTRKELDQLYKPIWKFW